MRSKSCCNPEQPVRATSRLPGLFLVWLVPCILLCVPNALAGGDAPPWMRALVSTPLPTYDEKTDAVLLYSETNVTVISADKIRTQVREAYKILRPNGRAHGTVSVNSNLQRKVRTLHGWCIPAQGKDFEVKDKDAIEAAPGISGGELITDVKFKILRIPAPDPGNIIGYEYEVEEQPFFLQEFWEFQSVDPVRESHYSLQLPPSWEFKSSWLNHAEAKPTDSGNNQWQWTLNDVKGLRPEPDMPPFSGVSGQMIVSFFPPGGPALNGFADWNTMGKWYWNLTSDRLQASPQIQQEVTTLTASQATALAKMQAIAGFVQREVRYVAIELGIGGWQPHPAADVFTNRYGDC